MGDLARDLAGHAAVGVDTSPFIYLWERHPRFHAPASELFNHLTKPGVKGVTSIITLIEACVHPKRIGRDDLVQAYQKALLHSRQVQTVSVVSASPEGQWISARGTAFGYPTPSRLPPLWRLGPPPS